MTAKVMVVPQAAMFLDCPIADLGNLSTIYIIEKNDNVLN